LALLMTIRAAAVLAAGVLVGGCDGGGDVAPGHERVTIDGRTFEMELALDAPTRTTGLSFRERIPEDGGMLFVFPDAQRRNFVMRDCYVPIDIIYLDGTGRVTAMHQMEVEPRREGESDAAYERRLTRYSSRFASQFVIELKGGMLDELDVEAGEKIELDIDRLKRLAR